MVPTVCVCVGGVPYEEGPKQTTTITKSDMLLVAVSLPVFPNVVAIDVKV